jgi:hypothetical protein
MRWAEIGLFLSPFVLYAIWRLVSLRLRPAAMTAATLAVAVLAATTVWYGLAHRAGPGGYVPAHVQDGRVVPGQAGVR